MIYLAAVIIVVWAAVHVGVWVLAALAALAEKAGGLATGVIVGLVLVGLALLVLG